MQYTVVLDPLSCDCFKYQQSGKACVDILTARLLRANGPSDAPDDELPMECVNIMAARLLKSNGPSANWLGS